MYSSTMPKRDSALASTNEHKSLARKSSSAQSSVVSGHSSLDSVEDILKLIRLLYSISATSMEEFGENGELTIMVLTALKFECIIYSVRLMKGLILI